jgi:site-specific recombinase XerD
MTIKVREIDLKGNWIGIQLDIHKNGTRKKKMLDIRYYKYPKTPLEREINKERKEIVKKIVANIELRGIDDLYEKGYQTEKDFFEYCDEFIERKAQHSEMRTFKSMIAKLKTFWKKKKLPCSEIDEEFLISFKDYLDATLNGSTPFNYFKKLKRIIKEATISKYFKTNPALNIKNSKGISAEKDILTSEEAFLLSITECSNSNVKRAFLFSCLTGLRYCDVKILKWSNINNENLLSIVQVKTKEKVVMPLHDNAIKLLGERGQGKSLVFDLPSHTGCLGILKKWVEKAEIDKHITWHCARHTFATSLVFADVGINMVSSLLGHKDLRQTQIYVRTAELSKTKAINKLPNILAD